MKWKYQVGVFDMHIMHIIPFFHTFWLDISKFPECLLPQNPWFFDRFSSRPTKSIG